MVSRFLIILMIALIPALSFMSYNIWHEFMAEKQKIRDKAFLFAEKVVKQQKNKIRYTKNILFNLAEDQAILNPENPNCSLFISRIQRLNPILTDIKVPLANGDLLCNALPLQQTTNVSGRWYFRNTIENGLFSMSKFQIDRETGLASMNFSVPVYDKDNNIIAAAVAVLSLKWWGEQLTDNFFPKDGAAFIVDRDGQVVASHYGIATENESLAMILTDSLPQKEGVYEVKSADNIRRLVAYKPMFPADSGSDAFVLIALPLESAYARVYAELQENIIALLFSLATLSFILLWGSRVKIILPIYQLFDTAKSLISEHLEYTESTQKNKALDNKYNSELWAVSDHFNLVIAEQKKQRQELKDLVYLDQVTQLPNRHALLNSIENKLSCPDDKFAIVLIDIDNFGVLNDRFGHDICDGLLVEIANKLLSLCQHDEEVGRWCGDEFVYILPSHKRDLLDHRINSILASLSEPIQLEIISYACQARCGVVVSHELAIKDASKLMHFADLAVSKVGDNKACKITYFKQDMETAGHERFELEAELRHVISRGELRLHYQPIINFKTGKYELAEALVRWQHPRRGLVEPLQFIELAERTGLIINIGRWVLCEAIRQLAMWRSDELIDINEVAVNLSPIQLQDNELIQMITATLIKYDIEPKWLTLEITESVLLDGGDEALATIAQFRSMGIRVALDDFGTGYSSLSYLSRIQLDKIKIDRSFVNEIGNARDDILIETIITMSHRMNLAVVAEGIETVSQSMLLEKLDCEYGQGYYFSKPLEASAITKFFKTLNEPCINS